VCVREGENDVVSIVVGRWEMETPRETGRYVCIRVRVCVCVRVSVCVCE